MLDVINLAPELELKSETASHVGTSRDARDLVLPGAKKIPTRYRPETTCDAIGCDNIVPAGFVSSRQKRAFCSPECRKNFPKRSHRTGPCAHCGAYFYVSKGNVGKQKYCCQEHRICGKENLNYARVGPMRDEIENYLKTTQRYRGKTLVSVKVYLISFFGYMYSVEGVSDWRHVTPSMVTRFIAAERQRGIGNNNVVGLVSTFYKTKLAEDDSFTLRNPIIANVHYGKRIECLPRPYKDDELQFIRLRTAAHQRLDVLLAMAIGEECGLRVGEVCNLRLSDVDSVRQTVFVRLPTKNMTTRTVPFHDQVGALLPLWLSQRSEVCGHDHLLHSVKGAAYSSNTLDHQFRQLFADDVAPAKGFSFHRLRHTWATRLMNGGMELAVLMQLGGWKDWTSMRRYIRVLPSTIRRQYEEAIQNFAELKSAPLEPTMSLVDFAMMLPANAAPASAEAA